MLHRYLTRRRFLKYLSKTHTDDSARLNELLLMFKDISQFHSIYQTRIGRERYTKFWYMNADHYLAALNSWVESDLNTDDILIELKGDYYVDYEPRRLYTWLRDTDGRVIPFHRLLGDTVEHGRVLSVWLDALADRNDLDAKYGVRKTRILTRDCCEVLTLALSLYTGVP